MLLEISGTFFGGSVKHLFFYSEGNDGMDSQLYWECLMYMLRVRNLCRDQRPSGPSFLDRTRTRLIKICRTRTQTRIQQSLLDLNPMDSILGVVFFVSTWPYSKILDYYWNLEFLQVQDLLEFCMRVLKCVQILWHSQSVMRLSACVKTQNSRILNEDHCWYVCIILNN